MNNAFRTFAVPAVVAISAIALSGCAASTAAAPATSSPAPLYNSLPSNVKSADKIKVAINVDYAPFESFEDDGKTITGVDKDLGDLLEKQLGVPFDYDNISFDAVIPGISAGRYDLALSAINDTTERQQVVDFVDYISGGGAILYPSDSKEKITDLDSLCGLKVAVVQGSAGITDVEAANKACVADGKDPIASSTYPGQGQQLLAIRSGRADATLIDSVTGGVAAKESNGEFEITNAYRTALLGVAFNKDNTELRDAVQKAFEAIEKNGSYAKVLKKYGLDSNEVSKFTINGSKQ